MKFMFVFIKRIIYLNFLTLKSIFMDWLYKIKKKEIKKYLENHVFVANYVYEIY